MVKLFGLDNNPYTDSFTEDCIKKNNKNGGKSGFCGFLVHIQWLCDLFLLLGREPKINSLGKRSRNRFNSILTVELNIKTIISVY